MQYGIRFFMGVFMLSWMFQHDYLNAYCFDLYACVLHFCICICSAQLSMFHMERRSRNRLIITLVSLGDTRREELGGGGGAHNCSSHAAQCTGQSSVSHFEPVICHHYSPLALLKPVI